MFSRLLHIAFMDTCGLQNDFWRCFSFNFLLHAYLFDYLLHEGCYV
uniref:Uncharacterized protein n=1 Tax=Rhizophora mucronata TaxID=61149 RepID=A0A2P2P997_RHIMU